MSESPGNLDVFAFLERIGVPAGFAFGLLWLLWRVAQAAAPKLVEMANAHLEFLTETSESMRATHKAIERQEQVIVALRSEHGDALERIAEQNVEVARAVQAVAQELREDRHARIDDLRRREREHQAMLGRGEDESLGR